MYRVHAMTDHIRPFHLSQAGIPTRLEFQTYNTGGGGGGGGVDITPTTVTMTITSAMFFLPSEASIQLNFSRAQWSSYTC